MNFGEGYLWNIRNNDPLGVREGKWEEMWSYFIAYMNKTLKEE